MFSHPRPTAPSPAVAARSRPIGFSALSLTGCVIIGLAMTAPTPVGAAEEKVLSKDTFGKWMSVCTQEAESKHKSCFAAQSLSVKQGNQLARLVEVQLKPIKGSKDSMSLVVNLPLGIYLPANAKMRIDGGAEINLTVLTCTQGGCLSAAKVGMDVVTAMRTGKEVDVGFIPQGTSKTSLIKLPLDGFDKALSAALKTK